MPVLDTLSHYGSSLSLSSTRCACPRYAVPVLNTLSWPFAVPVPLRNRILTLIPLYNRRCVRWRTQVFKIEGFVSLRTDEIKLWLTTNQSLVIVCTQARGLSASVSFLPLSLPPLSFFGSCFISRAAKTENPVPRSFFAPKPNGNACYAGLVHDCFEMVY